MTFLDWLQYIYSICSSETTIENWRPIAIGSNLAISLAYFWIPLDMAIVFRRWQREIPFPWLWTGFVAFIIACGATHIVHAIHVVRGDFPYSAPEIVVMVMTALISLGTATGFTIILPRVMKFTAPSEMQRRLQEAVDAATADLEKALAQERLLLREVHHRVKNNLQVTASMVNLHIRRSKQTDTSELAALRDRITAMADVHSQLQEAGVGSFSVRSFATELCRKLGVSYGRPDVTCHVTGADLDVPFERATPLALVMNEVVSNVFKHAFADGRGSRIAIEFQEDGGTETIRVSDDGAGMPEDGSQGGIGLTLIESLAVQLGGEVDWQRGRDGGTTFTMRMRQPAPVTVGRQPERAAPEPSGIGPVAPSPGAA